MIEHRTECFQCGDAVMKMSVKMIIRVQKILFFFKHASLTEDFIAPKAAPEKCDPTM